MDRRGVGLRYAAVGRGGAARTRSVIDPRSILAAVAARGDPRLGRAGPDPTAVDRHDVAMVPTELAQASLTFGS